MRTYQELVEVCEELELYDMIVITPEDIKRALDFEAPEFTLAWNDEMSVVYDESLDEFLVYCVQDVYSGDSYDFYEEDLADLIDSYHSLENLVQRYN